MPRSERKDGDAEVVTGELRSKVDRVWDAFWSGGIANPVEVIEQITYLLFIRRLDEIHTREERRANRTQRPMERRVFPEGLDDTGRMHPATRKQLEAGAKTTNGTFKINQQTVAGIEIPLPSLSQQRVIAAEVRAIDEERDRQLRNLTSLDALFASLQHRAFRGEL